MIAEVLKLIADKGPMLCAAYSRLTRQEPKESNNSFHLSALRFHIKYMTPEEEMRYLISTHDDKRTGTDSI